MEELSEVCFEDLLSRLLVRERNVNQLIETSGSKNSRVYDVGSVGCTYDENVLLAAHAIHFCQNLIDHAICCSSSITNTASSSLSNRIQLIKEEDTGCSGSSLKLN